MKIAFTAPYPPTTNLIYRMMRGHTRLTDIGHAYKETIAACALKAGWEYVETLTPCFQDHDLVGVVLHVYRPRKIGDIDNVVKLILDGMQNVTYANDKQVIELHIYRHDDKLNPRVEVQVIGLATMIDEKAERKAARAKKAMTK